MLGTTPSRFTLATVPAGTVVVAVPVGPVIFGRRVAAPLAAPVGHHVATVDEPVETSWSVSPTEIRSRHEVDAA